MVTTKIEVFYIDRTTSRFFNIELNMSLDKTTKVIAAIDIGKVTTSNRQLHIAVDVGIVGTTINLGNSK